MKKEFSNRMAAIDWIAEKAETEGQFEVMREQLNYNFIYTGTYFIEEIEADAEVILLGQSKDH